MWKRNQRIFAGGVYKLNSEILLDRYIQIESRDIAGETIVVKSIEVKSIEIDQHGQPVLVTSKGKKKLFSCRLVKLQPGSKTPKQILMEKRK